MKFNKIDSEDPYVYTQNSKAATKRPRGANQQPPGQSQTPREVKRSTKQGQRGPGRPALNLQPNKDFGSKLFSSLQADISNSAGSGGRRRAYTDFDDLLANDIKQSGKLAEHGRHRSSERNSTSQTKQNQSSELGGDSNRQLLSNRLSGTFEPAVSVNRTDYKIKRRETKL